MIQAYNLRSLQYIVTTDLSKVQDDAMNNQTKRYAGESFGPVISGDLLSLVSTVVPIDIASGAY